MDLGIPGLGFVLFCMHRAVCHAAQRPRLAPLCVRLLAHHGPGRALQRSLVTAGLKAWEGERQKGALLLECSPDCPRHSCVC